MKPHLLLSTLISSLILFAINPSATLAQTCIGNSGQPGNCSSVMSCSPPNIDGTGSCTTPQICCLTTLPPRDGGDGDCADTCNSSADCLDAPNNLSCTNNVCTHPSVCTSCSGTSGYAGSCLPSGVCDGLAKNSSDGKGSCTMGNICCTNAPSSETCNISAPPVTPANADFSVNLSSTDPNFSFIITTSPASCVGSCIGGGITPGASGISCTASCPLGDYTITARHGNVSCSTTVSAQNILGSVCQSSWGPSGYCAVIACPNGYIGGGSGTCPSSAQCCIRDPSDPFCVPHVSTSGIRTAVGCINAADPKIFIGQLFSFATRIGSGILFLCILYSGYMFVSSSGDQDRLLQAKQLLSNSLIGFIIIALSILLLNFVGITVLDLTNLGFGGL